MKRIASALGAFILLAGLAAILPVTAYADGLPGKSRISGPAVEASGPAFKTGCWVGARIDTQNTSLGSLAVNDFLYGGGGGCDYVIPGSSLVVGAFADVTIPQGTIGSIGGVDASWDVGARFGVLLSDRLLAYGLAAGAIQDFGIPGLSDVSLKLGVGAELMLTQNWTTGVEWSRTNIDLSGSPLVVPQDTIGTFLRYRF